MTSHPPRRSWQTARGLRGRQAILKAAVQCFVEVGYHRTTMSEVAKRAGVTRGQVQHHFAITRDLLSAAVRWLYAQINDEFDAALATRGEAGGDIIETAARILWSQAHGELQVAARELASASRSDAELRGVLDETRLEIENERRAHLERRYPEIAALDPAGFAMLADFMQVFISGLAQTTFATGEAERTEALLQFFIVTIRRFWSDQGKDPMLLNSEAVSARADATSSALRRALELARLTEQAVRAAMGVPPVREG